MQIAVIGAGNMGCVYGANLARVGEQVTLIDVWEEHVARIRAHGLRMEGLQRGLHRPVEATVESRGGAQGRRRPDLRQRLQHARGGPSARAVLKEDGYAVTLQNGVGNIEILTEVLGARPRLGRPLLSQRRPAGPGHVAHTNNGPTYLANWTGRRAACWRWRN